MLTPVKNRAAGSVVALAVGNALGAPFEFEPPMKDHEVFKAMSSPGKNGHAVGEWTSDTAFSIPILQAAASGASFEDMKTLDSVIIAWRSRVVGANDIGKQTSHVLRGLPDGSSNLVSAARELARQQHEKQGKSAGNGSLIRTAPLALAYLGPDDEARMASMARILSKLTHYDDEAADACVLLVTAMRRAILTGRLDNNSGLFHIPESRRELWATRIVAAERDNTRTRHFRQNIWVVEALQAAWCAVHRARNHATPSQRIRKTIEEVVRGGNDVDTVAAIAGALVGAVEGLSALPSEWLDKIHGWPNLKASDLVQLAVTAINSRPSYIIEQIILPTSVQDRIAGTVVGLSVGDALGAPYEFGPPLDDNKDLRPMTLRGHFGHAPGEWTDDTSMAIPILQAAARKASFENDETLDIIIDAWREWSVTSRDVGVQTRQILLGLQRSTFRLASAARELAKELHNTQGRSGGNGSLMRTAPLALAYLGPDDQPALAAAARALSKLTHYDDEAADACVLWCDAIRRAILTGRVDIISGLHLIPDSRQSLWAERIATAEKPNVRTRQFPRNGWVVEALQAAWCAVHHSLTLPPSDRVRETLEQAVRGGHDTDTVAAIAGGLIGAAEGASAIPAEWVQKVHGWPGLEATDLARLAIDAGRVSYFATET